MRAIPVRQSASERTAEQSAQPWPQDAVRLLDLVAQMMSKTLSQRLLDEMPDARQAEITLAQLHALRYLWLHERVFMGALAEGLEISYPSATNMVKRLAEKDLVARVVNPSDRREVEVLLTETGRALVTLIENERIARLARILGPMHESSRTALLEGLRQFLAHALNADDDIAREICLRCGWRASDTCPFAQVIPLFQCE
jgi:DNA-binding MarR family transcriptional regulator